MFRRRFAGLLVLAIAAVAGTSAVLAAVAANTKTLRIATAFDPNSLDPHAQALLYHTRIVSQIYESLVHRDQQFALEPQLATSWQQLSPTRWRFKLRPNVVFHDGAPFTADDAVFSLLRARAPTSQREFQLLEGNPVSSGLETWRSCDSELALQNQVLSGNGPLGRTPCLSIVFGQHAQQNRECENRRDPCPKASALA